MRREDECEPAARTVGGYAADFCAAACTPVTFPEGFIMAGAVVDARPRGERARGKPHHEEARGVLLLGAGYRRCGFVEEELAEVLLVHGDVVLRRVAGVCPSAYLFADGYLRG